MSNYVPELGQAAFGNPFRECAVPGYVHSHLVCIMFELDRVMENKLQRDYDSPFTNSGNSFASDVFEAHAYDWGAEDTDEGQPFNFKWHDVEISWYKYLGRGESMNREMDPDEAAQMLRECMESLS